MTQDTNTTAAHYPIDWTCKSPDTAGWKSRHIAAIRAPRLGFERAIVRGIRSWLEYAQAHKRRYESGIGKDGHLGEIWAAQGRALHDLLDGETGRLDCGTLSTIIHRALRAEGFGEDV